MRKRHNFYGLVSKSMVIQFLNLRSPMTLDKWIERGELDAPDIVIAEYRYWSEDYIIPKLNDMLKLTGDRKLKLSDPKQLISNPSC